jgi:5-methylcytosine-specific restriction endonuclease McrA
LRDQRKYAEYQREYRRAYRQRKREEKMLANLEKTELPTVKVDLDDLETYKLIQRMRKPRRTSQEGAWAICSNGSAP